MLTIVMVFSLMGLSVLAAPIAGAQTATAPVGASFMPVQSASALGVGMDKDQLSDVFDGVDSTAHLTAVGNANATTASWYICTAAGNTGTPTAADCTSSAVATDTAPVTRTPSVDGATVTNTAFDANWDIPATFDEDFFDVVVVLCNGAQPAIGSINSGGNCTVIRNDAIFLDDSATEEGTAPTLGEVGTGLPSGEIMGFCTQSTGSTCFATGTAFQADGHGGTTPTTYTLVFRTSPGVDVAGLCVDSTGPPNSVSTPNACTQTSNATLVNTTSTYKEWNATPTAIPAGDYDLGIVGNDDDATTASEEAECESVTNFTSAADNACTLDDHYKVAVSGSQAATGSTLTATFASSGAAASASNCTADDDAEDNRNGTTETVRVCVVDQFGNVLEGARVTFQSTGVGNFASCTGAAAGTATPTGDANTCTTTTNLRGVPTAFATNLAETGDLEGTPGDQTITVCVDNDTTQATQGCSDETLTDTLVKSWFGLPNHVHLVIEGTGDAADPCHTGDIFATVDNGDEATLLACVFNQDDVLTPTLIDGETATTWRLTWDNGDSSTVAFAENPPSETGEDGTETLDVLAVGAGSSTITVNLLTGNTEVDDSQVTITVPGEGDTECNDGEDNDGDGDIDFPNDEGCTSINDDTENSETPTDGDTTGTACEDRENDPNVIVGTDGADVLQGTSSRDIICGLGGDDVISGRAGNDLIQGNGGADTVGGGGGKDNVSGNGGRDNVSGNKGNDAVKGGGGGDTLKGNAGIDSLTGGRGNDSLQGGDGEDVLKGGGGADTLRGGDGDDALNGGGGTDQCFGNAGNDDVNGCE
jgi:Ca2+-binding RTX toxin-like protein